ncbi:MAG: hypothetical protein RLY14_89 [Planctomycetota bacterium]|jgi:Cu+-exporting ATPase
MADTPSLAIDPICGMKVDPQKAISAEKEGKRFYFCCVHCRDRFLASPSTRTSANEPIQVVSLGIPSKKTNSNNPSSTTLPTVTAPTKSCCGGGHSSSEAVIPSDDKAYFCPMCPGQESDSPGYCKICGMALERNPNFVDASLDEAAERSELNLRRKVIVACTLAGIVSLLAMLPMIGIPLERWLSIRTLAVVQALLTTPILIIAWPYWQSGFGAIRQGSANMFTLIGLGTWSAYLLSLIALLFPHWLPPQLHSHQHAPIYFESAAVIVALVLLGQWLEGTARKKTNSDLEKLVSMLPKVAHRIDRESIVDIPPLELVQGDLALVKPGETVPADGILEKGNADLDESLLTGESKTVAKFPGDRVIAGTINHASVIHVRVTSSGKASTLSRIIQSVAQAQRSRAPIQDLVDRVTTYFVPAVILIACLAASAWWIFGPEPRGTYAFLAGLSVLVIACPCALGLATPMSIIVGVGRAAREGFLVRDAKVFQKLTEIDTLVMDKTGTITEGKPQVVAWQLTESQDPFKTDKRFSILQLTASLEQASEHPLAQAIVHWAREEKVELLTPKDVEVVAGCGTQGIVAEKTIAVGKPQWILEKTTSKKDPNWPTSEKHPKASSVVLVSVDHEIVARCLLADQPRSKASETIAALSKLGLQLELLSGDAKEAVQEIAAQVGITNFRGEVTPDEKKARILQLKSSHHKVAMMGDGVNDAPALAAADVGISLATGTDLANQASDISLLEGDIKRTLAAIRLSRQVVSNIRQNLMLGLLYNLLALPIAAGLLYPWTGWLLSPMLAAAAMAASSLSVVANALRLRYQK